MYKVKRVKSVWNGWQNPFMNGNLHRSNVPGKGLNLSCKKDFVSLNMLVSTSVANYILLSTFWFVPVAGSSWEM